MHIILTGKAAAGKTTLAKAMEERGVRRIVTYTTRPMRPGEVNGVDYHFISDELFLFLVDRGFFAEWRSYDTVAGKWYYGSPLQEYKEKDDTVSVLTPEGVKNLKNKLAYTGLDDIRVIYINVCEQIRRKRMIARGDDPAEVERRIISDDTDFFYYTDYDYQVAQSFTSRTISPEDFAQFYISMFDLKIAPNRN